MAEKKKSKPQEFASVFYSTKPGELCTVNFKFREYEQPNHIETLHGHHSERNQNHPDVRPVNTGSTSGCSPEVHRSDFDE